LANDSGEPALVRYALGRGILFAVNRSDLMHRGNLSRRGFIRTSLTALGAAGLPLWYAREILAAQLEPAKKAAGTGDKITMGVIGVGNRESRAMHVYRESKEVKDIQY